MQIAVSRLASWRTISSQSEVHLPHAFPYFLASSIEGYVQFASDTFFVQLKDIVPLEKKKYFPNKAGFAIIRVQLKFPLK